MSLLRIVIVLLLPLLAAPAWATTVELTSGSLSSSPGFGAHDWLTANVAGPDFTYTSDAFGSLFGGSSLWFAEASPGVPLDASATTSDNSGPRPNDLAGVVTLHGVTVPWWDIRFSISAVLPDPHLGSAANIFLGQNFTPFTLTGIMQYNWDGTPGRFDERLNFTGAGTAELFIGPLGDTKAVRYEIAQTPEPATWLLLASGFAGLICLRKRFASAEGIL